MCFDLLFEWWWLVCGDVGGDVGVECFDGFVIEVGEGGDD